MRNSQEARMSAVGVCAPGTHWAGYLLNGEAERVGGACGSPDAVPRHHVVGDVPVTPWPRHCHLPGSG